MLEICSFDRPRQYACKHRCDRIPKVRQTARAVVPSLSGTLADCARPRGRSPDTKDCAIKKCSARLLTDSQGRLPAKVEYALCANTSLLACVYTIAVGCPSFTLCQELNTDGRFERSMVEHRSHLPSPRAKRCGFLMVRRLFLAMQLRKVSGERNTVPERIPGSVSGSRSRASSGGYAWGAAETTWSRAISATGAGALRFLEDFPPLGSDLSTH